MNRWDAFVRLVESPFARKHPVITLFIVVVLSLGTPATVIAVGSPAIGGASRIASNAVAKFLEKPCEAPGCSR